MKFVVLLFQSGGAYPQSRGTLTMPHDTTVGVPGIFFIFYVLVAVVLVAGVAKVAWDEKRGRNWKGKSYHFDGKRWNKDDGTHILRSRR